MKTEYSFKQLYFLFLFTSGPSIFSKILDGSIPTKFIHEDDKCVAFMDVSPQVLLENKAEQVIKW